MHYFNEEHTNSNDGPAGSLSSTARGHTSSLPDVGPDVPIARPLTEINESTDISQLTNAQLHELNQNLLEESTDVNRPLINKIESMSALRAEYEKGSPSFVAQIDWLSAQGYKAIRRTRGDGDCFYRSVAFSYIERILHATDLALAVVSGISTLEATLPRLEDAGFQKIVFEDFYDELVGLVKNIVQPDKNRKLLNTGSLLEAFQTPEVSNAIVVYFRLLTSAEIRGDPGAYEPFLFHPELGEAMLAREFCESFVEAVGKEADHVQMTALSKALQININVAYLDGRGTNGQVDFVQFQNASDTGTDPIILLYRPGHYDILLGPDDERMAKLQLGK